MNDDSLTDHNNLLGYELFGDTMDSIYDILLRNHFTYVEMDNIWNVLSNVDNGISTMMYPILDALSDTNFE